MQALEDLVDAVGEAKALHDRSADGDKSAPVEVPAQVTCMPADAHACTSSICLLRTNINVCIGDTYFEGGWAAFSLFTAFHETPRGPNFSYMTPTYTPDVLLRVRLNT